ncbi:putative phosphoenolpyruvate synthase [Nephila pilipes]|uniref:Putative phosphoenolpyruvate synthase n=1 Tax=Nephila pilipes TaxID=299642 RepID=A0A8X6PDM2_NEPPI|nr:putative phosphoenolpyruvate synthase [Nephila pilipes]
MVTSLLLKLIMVPIAIIYWIKWLIAYITIRFYKSFSKRRFELYDIYALGDPVKLGYIVPQLEKDLESPFPESYLLECSDEVIFYGVNSKSECLLVRIARGCNQVADAWIYLKLADGKTYNLTETMGYQQSADGTCQTFSCGKLSMHYLSPMRRWRIFFCGLLKEIDGNKTDSADTVFVKFVFLWKAASDVYDCTLDTNPGGFSSAMAELEWKFPFIPPVKKFKEALNFYAQTGVLSGAVSINDGPEYEMYLFGEKIRNLGKRTNIVGCKFNTILGSMPTNGFCFHLTNVSAPYHFNNLPIGFVVQTDGDMVPLKDLDINIPPQAFKKTESSFKAHFHAEEMYKMNGKTGKPIAFYSSQGWNGFLELSFIEFNISKQRGYGLIMSGEIYKEPKRPKKPLPLTLFPKTVPVTIQFTDDISRFGKISGGKGSSLGKLTQLSKNKEFVVPKGIVVTTAAYQEFLTPDILEAVKNLENIAYGNEPGDLKEACNKVSSIVEKATLSDKICHSIIKNLKDIYGDEVNHYKFAVRSSATGEDTAEMSAAGQMDTFLGVRGLNQIFTTVKKCWASQFGHIAVEYKRRNGQILNSPMAVVIQEMVACEVSGVLFTLDPVTNNPSVITITANYGLGETVVSGAVEPDTILLRRKDSEKLKLDSVVVGAKHQRIVMQDSGGTATEDLDENLRSESCLSKENALRLGKLAINIEKYYKSSCDIEWGILNDEIYILQSRPITTAAPETDNEIKHEFDAPLHCENEYYTVANIGEILPGATSTLGIEIVTKYYSNIFKRISAEKGLVDSLFKSKYFLTGFFPFSNQMMITVAELIIRYGFDTPRSKGFMISTFGRILDDPELLERAKSKINENFKETFKSKFMYYKELFAFDLGYERVKSKVHNYHLSFLNYSTANETYEALLKSCSDLDDAGRTHIDCSETSSNWNMHMFSILCQAKGSFDPDVYSDFARLLVTSSHVESANVPQAMQEVANQIMKDIGAEKFCSCLLRFVVPQCRRAVRGREAGKSLSVKFFDYWRQGFRHLAKQMVSEGRLPDADLIFFLTLDEINDLLETRSPSIISRANYRKKLFPTLEKYKFPEIMKGTPRPINIEEESADKYEFITDLQMKGIPVSQGITKGYARVAETLEEAAHLKHGEILITYSTDIGWSPYFPILSGVVTEIGGLISHGAVVSREYGLPCVVGIQGATKKFRTGDYVLLDAKKGILQRLPPPELR